MIKLNELKIRMVELEKKRKGEEKSLKTNVRYQKIQDRFAEITKEQDKIRRQKIKLIKKAKSRITSDGRSPYYSKGGLYYSGNINYIVLEAIKRVVPISHLTGNQIEKIATKLLEKEERKYPKLVKLYSKNDKLNKEQSNLWEEERKLEGKLQSIKNKQYEIRQKIEQLEREMKEPEKVKKQKAKAKTRADVFSKIDEIYEQLEKVEKEGG